MGQKSSKLFLPKKPAAKPDCDENERTPSSAKRPLSSIDENEAPSAQNVNKKMRLDGYTKENPLSLMGRLQKMFSAAPNQSEGTFTDQSSASGLIGGQQQCMDGKIKVENFKKPNKQILINCPQKKMCPTIKKREESFDLSDACPFSPPAKRPHMDGARASNFYKKKICPTKRKREESFDPSDVCPFIPPAKRPRIDGAPLAKPETLRSFGDAAANGPESSKPLGKKESSSEHGTTLLGSSTGMQREDGEFRRISKEDEKKESAESSSTISAMASTSKKAGETFQGSFITESLGPSQPPPECRGSTRIGVISRTPDEGDLVSQAGADGAVFYERSVKEWPLFTVRFLNNGQLKMRLSTRRLFKIQEWWGMLLQRPNAHMRVDAYRPSELIAPAHSLSTAQEHVRTACCFKNISAPAARSLWAEMRKKFPF